MTPRRSGYPILAAALALSACAAPEDAPEPAPVVAVRVATAETADVRLLVRAPALVHPRQQASVAPRITAGIRELLAHKGDRVAQGALLARLDDADLVAQRAEAEATLRQAQVLTDRRERLYAEGAIPQRELLATRTELEQAQARLDLVTAQREFTLLRSPFAGTLTDQLLYPGDVARPDSPVFVLMDLSRAVARGQVPEAKAVRVREGQPCAFTATDTVPEAFPGHVSVVTRAIDPARRSVEAWCEIPNAAGDLLPGAFGTVAIEVGRAPHSVVVPVAAVERAEGTSRGEVVVVDAEGVAHRRAVRTGEAFDGKLQVEEGLQGGERVVVEGGYGLPDGTAVRVGAEGDAAR